MAGQQGQGDGNQQGSGANGQQEQQGGQGTGGSLLDAEADQQHQQEQHGQQNGGDGNGGQQGGQQSDQQQSGSALTAEQVADLFERSFDRRINAVLREIRTGQQPGQQQGQQQQEQQGGQPSGQQQQQTQQPTGPNPADLREARSVYREHVADEIRFLGNEERDVAGNLAAAMLRDRLARGEDAETAGSAVAKSVASQVKALRKHYEDRTIAALRRRGDLPAEGSTRPGQPPRGPARPGDQSGFAAGQQRAQAMFADRLPKPQTQQ